MSNFFSHEKKSRDRSGLPSNEQRPDPEATKGMVLMSALKATVSWMERFLRDDSGPTAVEYAVMLALIVVVCIVAVTALGTNVSSVFNNVSLNTAVSGKGS